ncbi:hypothetical protein BH20VER2_BH20VER2_12210 [soil metagenome]
MLPIWVRDYGNKKLHELEGYRGSITEVDIHLSGGVAAERHPRARTRH